MQTKPVFVIWRRNRIGSKAVFPLLSFCFFCCSSLFVRLWRLCGPYMFLIPPPFTALKGLCFVIVEFPGYRH